MTDFAAQVLWGTEELNYRQLVSKLTDRFGSKGVEEKYQNELRYRRRNRNEPIRELAQDIQRLMSLAYPNERSSLADHIARDAFLTALDDPELDLKVREREPSDLETAVKLAQRFEIYKFTVESSDSSKHRVNRNIVEDNTLEARLVSLEQKIKNETLSEQCDQKKEFVAANK